MTRIFRGLWNFSRVFANNFCGLWGCCIDLRQPFGIYVSFLIITIMTFWAFIRKFVNLVLLFLLDIDILEQVCYNVDNTSFKTERKLS